MSPTYRESANPAGPRVRPRRLLGRYRYVRLRWRVMFALVDVVGWALFGPWRIVQRGMRRRRPWPEPRSILVVQLDHLGDAVLSTGMLAALRRAFPRTRIDVLCSRWSEQLFAMCPAVDSLRVAPVSRFDRTGRLAWVAAIFACGWRLRRGRYDLAVDVRGEFPHSLLMWLAGARRRLGFNAGGGGFLLTESAAYVRGRHETLSRLALLRKLQLPVGEEDVRPFLPPRVNEERRIRGSRPKVVVHVGAGTPAKRWPAEHWREVVGWLVVEYGARVTLVGSSADRACAERVLGFPPLPGVADRTGRGSLQELVDLLRSADLFLGADSGPAHLAAAVGCPTIVLFSGTNDPAQWRPCGERVVVLRSPPACSPCHREVCPWSDHPCMRGLSPKRVLAAVADFLPAADRPAGPKGSSRGCEPKENSGVAESAAGR